MDKNPAQEALASIARCREVGLKRSVLTEECLASVLPRNAALPDFAERIASDIAELAEQRYIAEVRKIAMDLMEHDGSLTAAEATAWAESMILEALVS